jgi:plastocyanin
MNLLFVTGVGTYNLSSQANANYAINTTVDLANFTVFGYMNVTQEVLDPSTHIAFESTTHTCTVQDQHTAVNVSGANVSFYKNATIIGTNLTNSTGQAQYTFSTNSTGTYNISCSVSDQLGIYYFAGDQPNASNTLVVNPFAINTESPANNTIVDRDAAGADPETITLNVSVPSYVPDGVNITFIAQTSNPLVQGPLTLGSNTTSNSYALLTYNPNQTISAGTWTWNATADAGYANTSSTYDVYGDSLVVFTQTTDFPPGQIDQNETLEVRTNYTSSGPENATQINTSFSAQNNITIYSPTNSSINTSAYINPYWQGLFEILNLSGVGQWNVSSQVASTYHYSAESVNRSFDVYGYANTTQITLDSSSIPIFTNSTVQCRLQDQHTNVSVSSARIEFFVDGVSQINQTTNSTGWATASIPFDAQGNYNITCQYDTNLSIYYKSGDQHNITTQIEILPYEIDAVSPANNTLVDRDSVAADPDTISLVVQAQTSIPAGRNITFFANITNPSLGITNVTLGQNTSNSSGAATLNYNPNSTIHAGIWTWGAYDVGAGKTNKTRTYQVLGSFTVGFANATLDPNSEYNQTDTTRVNATLTSAGPETLSELNSSYNASVLATYTPPTENTTAFNLSYINPMWSATQLLARTAEVGNYTAELNATATYFYDASQANRNFTVFGLSNLTLRDLSDTQVVRLYQNASFFANYSDTRNQSINYTNSQCQIRFNTTGTYNSYDNMTFDSSIDEYTYYTNFSTFGNYTFNVFCDDPLYASQNETDIFIINKSVVNSLSPANATILDRDGVSADPDSTELLLNVPDAIAGINVTIAVDILTPNLSITNRTIGYNFTEAGGNITFTWNPDDTLPAGRYEWYGYAGSAEPNNTKSIDVYGSLTTNYTSPLFDSNSLYNQTNTAIFDANITSAGNDTNNNLNNSYNLTYKLSLIKPSSTTINTTLDYNQTWTTNNTFSATDEVGVWNTSANVTANFFYALQTPLRNFTVYGLTNVSAFDDQDLVSQTLFAGNQITHYANWTHTDATPVNTGTCTLTLYNGTNVSMSYTNTTWQANASYPFAGIFRYNTTCQRAFYYTVQDQDNVSIATNVSLNASYSMLALSENTTQISLSVVNLKGHREDNVSLFTVIPSLFTATYVTTPLQTIVVTGQDAGTMAEWNFNNLTGFENKTVILNVTGSQNFRLKPLLGVTTPSQSTEVYG